jgi:uncharacterized protein YyaL (SSP411 family)
MSFLGALVITAVTAGAPPPAANRLATEKSRYLRQHATNPIDWFPWGEEAFRSAREQNRLIFLSIGYSTCHWCHVMERESFSDPEIGSLMNGHFVAIKVDREERPDVDSTYMAAAKKLMNDPGWPLNIILTPEGKPFFAAAYIPRERLMALLPRIASTWREHPQQIHVPATLVMQSLKLEPIAPEASLDARTLTKAYEQLASRFDQKNGGFLPAPKLPAGHQLMFLLRYWRRAGEPHALKMVETTLDRMRDGAMYDRLEFGFHRYSVDAEWKEPHYEKMLYDQAVLSLAYLEGYQATGKETYARTAREIFQYVLRNLQSPEGAFYSAQDADERYYSVANRTNLPRPARDEKIVGDWNGLMIAALAQAALVLDDETYATHAKRAADYVLTKLREKDGRLLHQAGRKAYLDDYAFVVWGLLNLYEATFEVRYLDVAIALQADALRQFRDDHGRFYLTSGDAEALLVRPRETGDGALPSGNSVQLMNLVRLARITANPQYETAARELLRATEDEVTLAPSTAAHLMNGLDFFLGPSFEVVLAGNPVDDLRRAVFGAFVPNKVVLRSDAAIHRIAPFTKMHRAIDGKPMAYVCTSYLCRLPTGDPVKVRELLLSSKIR